jgi:hypothetical protein
MARRSECACKSARLGKSEPALLDGLVSVSKLGWQQSRTPGVLSPGCALRRSSSRRGQGSGRHAFRWSGEFTPDLKGIH